MTKRRNIIGFDQLSRAWQAEARSNHDEPEDIQYIEPEPHHKPDTHVLYDLANVMYCHQFMSLTVLGEQISNNSSVLFYVNQDTQECVLKFK